MEEVTKQPNQENQGNLVTKRTIPLIILCLLIIVVLGVFFFSKKKDVSTTPPSSTVAPTITQLDNAHTTLTLVSNPAATTSSSESVNLAIDTGENKVTAVQVELSYDPTVITNIDILPATFFENPIVLLKKVDTKNGKISYAIAMPPTGAAKTGQGTVATITFTTSLQAGQKTGISFLPKTLVTAEGIRTTVLKTTTGTTILGK